MGSQRKVKHLEKEVIRRKEVTARPKRSCEEESDASPPAKRSKKINKTSEFAQNICIWYIIHMQCTVTFCLHTGMLFI